MTIYFAGSDLGFYDSEFHDVIPDDAVEITPEKRDEILDGQRLVVDGVPINMRLEADKDGLPVLVTPPPPTIEQQAATARRWRDERLSSTDGMVARHRDEVEFEEVTTLTKAQYKELAVWRSALRDWPSSVNFPGIPPIAPNFVPS